MHTSMSVRIALLVLAATPGALRCAAEPVRLAAENLAVTLDPAFPRAVAYTWAGRYALAGQAEPVRAVQINGAEAECRVSFQGRGGSAGVYRLEFPGLQVACDLGVTVADRVIEWRVLELRETGAVRVRTLAFPGNAMLRVDSGQPDAALASVLFTTMKDAHAGVYRERIGPLAEGKVGADTGNYLFLSAGGFAAGIGCGNFTDIQRTAWALSETGGLRVCTAQNPVWEFRAFDDEPAALPWVKVFVTDDLNGDGAATWQDAALVYRRTMPMPFGHEFVKSLVAENIAMNFASGAQQPFLSILDGIKRTWLATDGLGQQVVIKGFSSEGHDSANTDYAGHWNERAGGLRDFSVLFDRAGDYNARVGIHINASEAYPEAQRYHPDILQRDANGRFKGGWAWLDHAHMIDKEKDIRSGRLFAALEAMRLDLPKLDFVYVDTYWEHGWPAWQTARKINDLGMVMYTEGDKPLDPWTAWAHWRGGENRIAKFIWFSDRDLFGNDAILRAGRSDDDGYMGWQNRHDFNNHIRATFARRLPAKYLQHFELLRWTPGSEAVFSDEMKVVKSGDHVTVRHGGAERMSWTGAGANQRLFVPWPPREPAKIYVWDEVGGEKSWTLPPAWRGAKSVFLYRLAGTGRTGELEVAVAGGDVTLLVEKGVPYVMYPKRAKPSREMEWTEGGPIRDAGFDSRVFDAWVRTPADTDAMRIEEGPRGDPRLVIGPAGGAVSQAISVAPGRTYAAAAWAQVTGTQLASIEVHCGGQVVSNHVTRTTVRHSAPNDPRTGTRYQRLAVWFDVPPGGAAATLALKAGAGAAGSQVEFDAVRVVPARRAPEAARHTFWEDFEDVPLGGYGPFTGCPGERTHLSEAHPPFTRDTISGRFSLKSRDGGRVLFTLPSTLRLKPLTRYRVTCDTIGAGRLVAEVRGRAVMTLPFPNLPDGATGAVTGEFATGRAEDAGLALFRDGGDSIVIDNLAVDELGPAPDVPEAALAPEPPPPGMRVLMEEPFSASLSSNWAVIASSHPGTRVVAEEGALYIAAAAHVSALIERALPPGTKAVECGLESDGDLGETWGPGICLVWPSGAALRVNVRAGGQYGIDSTAFGQRLVGRSGGDAQVLRIRITPDQVLAEARSDHEPTWQMLAAFPRASFAGDPARVRLGKMHGVEGVDDHTSPGPEGGCRFGWMRVFGQ